MNLQQKKYGTSSSSPLGEFSDNYQLSKSRFNN